jgi:hypothetical protein
MALLTKILDYSTNTPLAAPTVSESIPDPGPGVFLLVVNGATPTTLTLVAPGNLATGVANPDTVVAIAASSTYLLRVDGNYRDPSTGAAAITFANVTTVTASIIRS